MLRVVYVYWWQNIPMEYPLNKVSPDFSGCVIAFLFSLSPRLHLALLTFKLHWAWRGEGGGGFPSTLPVLPSSYCSIAPPTVSNPCDAQTRSLMSNNRLSLPNPTAFFLCSFDIVGRPPFCFSFLGFLRPALASLPPGLMSSLLVLPRDLPDHIADSTFLVHLNT